MTNANKVKILMVDDRPENLLALEAVLMSENYHLVKALSGEEALKWVLKEDFAVILLDVQMPGLNGFETAKIIKERERSRHIPIIFVTAISQAKEHVYRGYSVGAIDYIFKPFHPETLKMKIEAFVTIHENHEQIKRQRALLHQRTTELEAANEKLSHTTTELRKAEALARMIGETSVDTIITLDAEGVILAVNPAVQAMFGYEADELALQNVTKLLPYYDQPETRKVIETTAVRQDGSLFPVDIQIGASNIDGQELFVCSIRDITERKEQYDTLERLVEERTLEVVNTLESITDAFYAVDDQWSFTYINQEAERQLGKSRSELLGQNFWEALPEYTSGLKRHFERAMEEQAPVHFEVGSAHAWHGMHVYPSKTGLSVYFRDITERKRMEQDLRLSEERFRKIFNSSPSMIAIRSLQDGHYLDVNESWLAHTGYEYQDVVGHTLYVIHDGVGEQIPDQGLFPVALDNLKISYRTKSGEEREGLLSTETIEIQGETCLLSVITDITERSVMEREMARLDRLNLVGEMAAGIAHEIRNPMTTVRGFLQLTGSQPNAPTSEYINLMVHELDRANSIITEFLTLAKNKTADKQLKNLNAVIEALHPLIQAEALLSDKDVLLDLEECPALSIDEKEIRQMILNLALNGLEAMEAGKHLLIRTTLEEGAVVLEIRDQGAGIPVELLEKIGTPFFTTKEQGTGLGLAVCYSVAARHKAIIDIKTGEMGTSFFIRFAREEENASL